MATQSDRRKFLKNLGVGGLAAGITPTEIFLNEKQKTSQQTSDTIDERAPGKRPFNAPYTDEYLNRLAFPIGGMGAGMFCLEGSGAISHMSVRNKPDIYNEPGIFAAIHLKGITGGSKLLEGPVPDWKKFGQPGSGNGATGAITGLPRFDKAVFTTKFPFGHIDLTETNLPLKVTITGWSPFIPTDDDNSSLPCGALEYKFRNNGTTTLDAVFSYHARNFLKIDKGANRISSYPKGFILSEEGTKEKPFLKTDFLICSDQDNTVVDHCWFRGGWWDPLTMVWNSIRNGEIKNVPPVEKDAPGASLFIPFKLSPGQEKTIRLMMVWYCPDSDMAVGKTEPKENCNPEDGCCASPDLLGLDKYDKNYDGKFHKPWYSSRYKDVQEVAAYWDSHYRELKKNSQLFTDAFYASTLAPEVIEAVAANLTILKSPTVLRQFDGRLWNWEGCGDSGGCCHGSCTHVWNYAQAIPHLFPALERSLRATEFCENQSKIGHQNFRATLPVKPNEHNFHAAADGQLGGIMKVYREWRISGDSDWMKKIYPLAKQSMDYSIETWDPRHAGVIEEPHHNTYDIEFWGPDGMHGSFYIGALNAAAAMGKHLGKDVKLYEELARKAKTYLETELYNGEYFFQQIKFTGLKAANPIDAAQKTFGGEYSEEARKLLEKEGPKYQYGTGCLADGVLGAWIARMCGLDDPLDVTKLRSHLMAVHKYNLKKTLAEHANPQRPAFALGDEGGLLLCTWPKGGKLSLPFVYSDEVWTGIEHQVASHLMLLGQVTQGREILQACRDRYSGKIRNPFNEYECGHWYARALASYGFLQSLTGVRFDAVDKILYIDSKVGDFTSFLSTETGFGTVSMKLGKASVKVVYGKIPVEKISIAGKLTNYV